MSRKASRFISILAAGTTVRIPNAQKNHNPVAATKSKAIAADQREAFASALGVALQPLHYCRSHDLVQDPAKYENDYQYVGRMKIPKRRHPEHVLHVSEVHNYQVRDGDRSQSTSGAKALIIYDV